MRTRVRSSTRIFALRGLGCGEAPDSPFHAALQVRDENGHEAGKAETEIPRFSSSALLESNALRPLRRPTRKEGGLT
jgi:hypothetical protein